MSNKEAIILVLGCQVERTGEGDNGAYAPSAALKHRLDGALKLYRSLIGEEGVTVLLSGKGRGEVSEASVMAEYLMMKGVPSSAMLLDEKSMSTIENCLESLTVIHNYYLCLDLRSLVSLYYETTLRPDGELQDTSKAISLKPSSGLPKSMYVVSSDFHIPRTKVIWEYFGVDTLFELKFKSTPTPAPERESRRQKESRTNIRKRLCRYSRNSILKLFSEATSS